jgi:hypothetical protein
VAKTLEQQSDLGAMGRTVVGQVQDELVERLRAGHAAARVYFTMRVGSATVRLATYSRKAVCDAA